MARAGAFKELDCALTWHPSTLNRIYSENSLANTMLKFSFKGVSSHASGAPELGRSALDAVELMNVGANYLREHMSSDCRIHYAITNSGGRSPNVVQSEAEVLYMVRAPEDTAVRRLLQRVIKVAEGAALMTETTMTHQIVKSCVNFISNRVLEGVVFESMRNTPLPAFSNDDRDYARRFVSTLSKAPAELLASLANRESTREGAAELRKHSADDIYNFIVPWDADRDYRVGKGTTDVGDVSWHCPVAQFYAATWTAGTPGHSWQVTAQGTGPIAHKMMLWAARVLFSSAQRLFTSPGILENARREFTEMMKGRVYVPMPPEVKPVPLSEI
jgi:aminobenzoyl-glutamate utilization protein B